MLKNLLSRKKIIVLGVLLSLLVPALHAKDGELFKYPDVPESKTRLDERCNFLVFHFWDKANLTTAFSSRQKFHNTLGDWFNIMPYATADTVHMAISNLIEKVGKKPENLSALARMAEAWVYSDTSDIHSEELYLPFAQAAAASKKVSKAERQRFAAQVKVIESSGLNATVPAEIQFTDRAGSNRTLGSVVAQQILLAFLNPGCNDCDLDLVRLKVNSDIRELVDAGVLAVILLKPDDADEEWAAEVSRMPESWIVGTFPDADEYFDLSRIPSYYMLDSRRKVLAKDLTMEQLMNISAAVNAARKRQASAEQ